MRMKNLITPLILLTLIFSCDNKQKREQALKDLYTKQQQQTDTKTSIENLESKLTKMYGELEVAKDNINRTEGFHFLRTASTREQQIREAVEYKVQVEKSIENIKTNISTLKDSVSLLSMRIIALENVLKD